ncbi:Bug family tripartite tricarboxylate transporter substrate binding protein [Comamonas serinivorans]|nr:tripartite tricarboxylate transporter substrate binding protein [Comamonas serinivorans]
MPMSRLAARFRAAAFRLTSLALAGALTGAAGTAWAQEGAYPSKPIRLVIPFAPGGVTDLVGRAMAQSLTQHLGQPVVPENRAGASGVPGAEIVAKAAPDGYTLMVSNISINSVNAAAFARLPYHPQNSFTLISQVSQQPLLVTVNPQVPVKTLPELVALAKAQPGSLNFGSAGTSLQLASEAFNQAAGLRMTHVPYKGSGPAMTDLVAGHIQVLFDATSSLGPFVKDGRVRALAITAAKRSPQFPDVPTLVELGYPSIEVNSWQGLAGPAGLPPAVVARLGAAMKQVADDPQVKAQFDRLGIEAVHTSPEAFRRFAAAETARWQSVAQKAGLKPE